MKSVDLIVSEVQTWADQNGLLKIKFDEHNHPDMDSWRRRAVDKLAQLFSRIDKQEDELGRLQQIVANNEKLVATVANAKCLDTPRARTYMRLKNLIQVPTSPTEEYMALMLEVLEVLIEDTNNGKPIYQILEERDNVKKDAVVDGGGDGPKRGRPRGSGSN